MLVAKFEKLGAQVVIVERLVPNDDEVLRTAHLRDEFYHKLPFIRLAGDDEQRHWQPSTVHHRHDFRVAAPFGFTHGLLARSTPWVAATLMNTDKSAIHYSQLPLSPFSNDVANFCK